jgi:hypothetical protein
MNTKDILKYAAFAVGAYMLYRYAKDAGWLGKLLPSPAVTPDQKAIEAAAAAAKKKAEEDAAAGKITADQLAALKAQIERQAAELKALASAPAAGSKVSERAPDVAPAPVEQVIIAAANGDSGSIQVVRMTNVRFNSDQWNYYRTLGGGDVPVVDLFPPGNREYLMSIDEYLAARAREGLSGLGAGWQQLAHMQSSSPWIC